MIEHDIWLNVERNLLVNIGCEVVEETYKHSKVHKMYAPDSDQKFDTVIITVSKVPDLYALTHRFIMHLL